MCRTSHAMLLLATASLLCWLSFAYADEPAWVQVAPKATDEVLANPGMGWETFHRTANNDKNLPSWIPSTVHYARWGWRELEPEVLAAHLDFIKRLGERYDGHPDIDHVDIGSVGWWGEWHMSESTSAPLPTRETQKKIVDA